MAGSSSAVSAIRSGLASIAEDRIAFDSGLSREKVVQKLGSRP